MKPQRVRAVFLIPFYDQDMDGLLDAVASIRHYEDDDHVIVCLNDCIEQRNADWIQGRLYGDDIRFVVPDSEPGWPKNTYGPLLIKKYQAIEFALANFDFDFIIGMDTDALVTGAGPIAAIADAFRRHPADVGLLGSFRVKADGSARRTWQWGLYLLYLAYVKSLFHPPSVLLRRWMNGALGRGYRPGDHVLFGAYAVRRRCLARIVETVPRQRLIAHRIYDLKVGDDVLFGLLACLCRCRIGDMGRPGDILAVGHKSLPIAKETIRAGGTRLIHSVRAGWQGESEAELRSFFRRIREAGENR